MMTATTVNLYPLVLWYQSQNRQLPWRDHWQKTRDPYGVWVSEIMLQQTLIKVVIPAYERFMRRLPTIYDLAQASEEELREAVRGLGYYRRFRFLHQCAIRLTASKPQQIPMQLWPQTRDELLTLPGIGEYTSAAIASIAFGEEIAVVDGNVERVLCRLMALKIQPRETKAKKLLAELAQSLLKNSYPDSPLHDKERHVTPGIHNQAMMELGQMVCTPTQPRCFECPISSQCQGFAQGLQEDLPIPLDRKAPMPIAFKLWILAQKKGQNIKVALFERSPKARFLKSSWGFLSDWRVAPSTNEKALRPFWIKTSEPNGPSNLGTVKHSITHHKIEAEVLYVSQQSSIPPATGDWHRDSLESSTRWVCSEEVEPLLVSNLDRKAWRVFQKTLSAGKIKEGLRKLGAPDAPLSLPAREPHQRSLKRSQPDVTP